MRCLCAVDSSLVISLKTAKALSLCDYCGSNFHVMPPFLKDSVLLTTPFQIYSGRGRASLYRSVTPL